MTILAIALLLGGAPTAEHRVAVDHPAGAVDATYRSTVAIARRQLGAVAPGGRPQTLRCAWSAGMTVERSARHASGAMLTRTLRRDDVLAGSRPGWCGTHRDGIAREVASRGAHVRDQLLAVAAEDRTALHAELDRHLADHAG